MDIYEDMNGFLPSDIEDMEYSEEDTQEEKQEYKTSKGDGLVFYEKFNQHVLYSILQNEDVLRTKLLFIPDRENDPFLLGKKILNRSNKGNLKVKHFQINGQGRKCANGGISLANIARQIRHAICEDKYSDIDMVNAHPVILQHICKLNGIECDYLDEYVKDREGCLSEMSELTKEQAKKAYLTVINGKDGVISSIKGASKTLKKFAREMKDIRKSLIKIKSRQYKLWCKYQKTKKRKDNFEGSFINSLMCDMENNILMKMWNYFGKPNDAVLCFDGIMLDKNKSYDLEGCCEYIKKSLGITINLKIKEMDEGFELDEILNYEEISIDDIKGFDNKDKYLYNHFVNEYSDKTKEWEDYESLQAEILPKVKKVIAYISMGKGFYIKKLDTNKHIHDMCPAKASDLQLKFKIKDQKEIKLTEFIHQNSNQLVYSTTCCKPDSKDVEEFQFNFWAGYKAQMVEHVDMNLINPILDLLKVVWADNDKDVYKVLLYFWSELLKNPQDLPNKENAILLIGQQGIGKDFVVNFFQNYVIGENLVGRLTGIESAVGSFNGALRGKALCVVNEMASTREQFRSNFDKIKPLISNNEIMINQKGVDSYPVNNISSWLFFSNHDDVLYLEKDDRRYTCLRANSKYKGNHKHFKNIIKQCFNQEAGNHMYTYLMNLQEEEVLHPSELKTTALKEELKYSSLTSSERFIHESLEFRKDNLGEEQDEYDYDWRLENEILAKDLYKEYKQWCDDNGERRPATNTKFGRAIKELLEKKRTKAGMMYTLPAN